MTDDVVTLDNTAAGEMLNEVTAGGKVPTDEVTAGDKVPTDEVTAGGKVPTDEVTAGGKVPTDEVAARVIVWSGILQHNSGSILNPLHVAHHQIVNVFYYICSAM